MHRILSTVFILSLICDICFAVVEDFDGIVLVAHLDVRVSPLPQKQSICK